MASEHWLRIRAPFGAFRWLQAGVYRASSPTIPPSAAWGMVLNFAGIDTRAPGSSVVTSRRSDAPRFEVAVGEVEAPQVCSLYQQLHGYPVGSSGKDLAARAHGSKYWVAPVRREVLIGLDLIIGIRNGGADLIEGIGAGLAGKRPRYGLPFLGDNNFLIDRVDQLETPVACRWFTQVADEAAHHLSGTCRLTVDIDREDGSKTRAPIFHRTDSATVVPPDLAWTWVPRQPEVPPA